MMIPINTDDAARLRLAEFISESLVNGEFGKFLRARQEQEVAEMEIHALRLAQELHARPFSFVQETVQPAEDLYPHHQKVVMWGPKGQETITLNEHEKELVIEGKRVEAMQAVRARVAGLELHHAKYLVEQLEDQLDHD